MRNVGRKHREKSAAIRVMKVIFRLTPTCSRVEWFRIFWIFKIWDIAVDQAKFFDWPCATKVGNSRRWYFGFGVLRQFGTKCPIVFSKKSLHPNVQGEGCVVSLLMWLMCLGGGGRWVGDGWCVGCGGGGGDKWHIWCVSRSGRRSSPLFYTFYRMSFEPGVAIDWWVTSGTQAMWNTHLVRHGTHLVKHGTHLVHR